MYGTKGSLMAPAYRDGIVGSGILVFHIARSYIKEMSTNVKRGSHKAGYNHIPNISYSPR